MSSSAGWKIAATVPDQSSFSATSRSIAPTSHVTCMSWPQACMSGVCAPSGPAPVATLA